MCSPWPQLGSTWKSLDEVLLLAQLAGLQAGFADVVMTRRHLQATIHCKAERWSPKGSKKPRSDCSAELIVLESGGTEQDWRVVKSHRDQFVVRHERDSKGSRRHPHGRCSKHLQPLARDEPITLKIGYNDIPSAGALNPIEACLRVDAFGSGRLLGAHLGPRTKEYFQSLSFKCETTKACSFWIEFIKFKSRANYEVTEVVAHAQDCGKAPCDVDPRLQKLLDQVAPIEVVYGGYEANQIELQTTDVKPRIRNKEAAAPGRSSPHSQTRTPSRARSSQVDQKMPQLYRTARDSTPSRSSLTHSSPVDGSAPHANPSPDTRKDELKRMEDGELSLNAFFRELCEGDSNLWDILCAAANFLENEGFTPVALMRSFEINGGREMLLEEMERAGIKLAASTVFATLMKKRQNADAQGVSLKVLGKRKAVEG